MLSNVTYTVDSLLDDGSPGTLRWAIEQANTVTPTDTNVIRLTLPNTSKILLQTPLPVLTASSIAVRGGFFGGITIERDPALPDTSPFSIFVIDGGASVTIASLTLANGRSTYGGGIENHGTLTLSSSILTGNSAERGGGLFNDGTATLNSDRLTDNLATDRGGGIDNEGTLSLTSSTVSNSTAGTAAANVAGTPAPPSSSRGGGIYNHGTLTSVNSRIASNSAAIGGGLDNDSGTADVLSAEFADNTAMYGGAIYNNASCTFTFNLSDIVGNSASEGGGLWNAGTANIGQEGKVANNSATADGGGIANRGSLTVTDIFLTGNSAQTGGAVSNSGSFTLVDSTLTENAASDQGGAIRNESAGAATLTNSTLSGNSATNHGGGIASSGTLTVINTTLVRNHVKSAGTGGGLAVTAGNTVLENTIVAENTRSGNLSASADDISGFVDISRSQSNLVGTGGSGGLVNGAGGNQVGVANPGLGELGDYGGDFATIPLLPGSPAIDAANAAFAPGTDERGISRPQGSAPDIGAFESQGFAIRIAGGSNQGTLVNAPFAQPFVIVVSSAHNEPVAGGTVSFHPPAQGPSAVLSSNAATIRANGTASVTGRANALGGTYGLPVSSLGAPAPVSFTLTNLYQPAFTNLRNQTATYGTPAVTISGTLAAGTHAPAGDHVRITLAGTVQDALINNDGAFSVSFHTARLGVTGVPYAVSYTYQPRTPYLGATGSSQLTITPAPLTIIADDKTMPFGGAVPALTATYQGFVNAQTPADLTTQPQLSTTATSDSPAGSYPITVAGASSPNYAIHFVTGRVAIAPYVPPPRPRYRAGDAFNTTLYHEILARGPEPQGLRYWMRSYVSGVPTLRIAQGFARSTERQTLEQEGRAPHIPLGIAYRDAILASRKAWLPGRVWASRLPRHSPR